MVEAYEDITAADTGDGFDLAAINMRFEMLGIDFDDFIKFVKLRLEAFNEVKDVDSEWERGYVQAAMEYFMYGNLTGKEAAIDMEIKLNDH